MQARRLAIPRRPAISLRLAGLMCAAAGALCLGPRAWAQPATRPAEDAASQEEIARAIRDLGDDSWRVREAASRRLWEIGRAAQAALEAAAKGGDAEVRIRAGRILENFRYGIYPDTPQDVVDLIERCRRAAPGARHTYIRQLLDKGLAGCRAALAVAQAEPDSPARERILRELHRRVGKVVPLLLAEGDFAQAEALLTAAAGTGDHGALCCYAAHVLLRGKLDEAIGKHAPRAEADAGAAKALAFLYRAKGDLGKAAEAARLARDADLLKGIRFERGDWKALATTQAEKVAGGKASIEDLGFLAAYRRLAGDREGLEDAVERIKKCDKDGHWHQVEALLINDRPADAIELAVRQKAYLLAFRLLCGQLRFRRALELPQRARSEGSDQWFALAVQAAETRFGLGEKDEAAKSLSALSAPAAEDEKLFRFRRLVQAEAALGMTEEALKHCVEALTLGAEAEGAALVAAAAFPRQADYAAVVYGHLRRKHPRDDASWTVRRLRDFLAHKQRREVMSAFAEEVQQASANLPPAKRAQTHVAVAAACAAAGHDDLALEQLTKAEQTANPRWARDKIWDLLSGAGRWAEAAERSRKASRADRGSAKLAYLAGAALARSGKQDEGKKLMALAELLPLGDDYERYELAEAMAKCGKDQDALRQAELILRTGEFMSWAAGHCLGHGLYWRALADGDYLRAAACQERSRLRCLAMSTSVTDARAHLLLSKRVHDALARGHAKGGDVEKALAEARLCQAALPGDIDPAIALVSDLDRLGRRRDADAVLALYFDRLEQVCKAFPKAARQHNSLAWLAVRCRRRLDRARQHAERAVELAPEAAACIDTLAEVHFQQGRRAEAVRLIKRCIELDPKTEYFRRQLKRFQSADPATDPPEHE